MSPLLPLTLAFSALFHTFPRCWSDKIVCQIDENGVCVFKGVFLDTDNPAEVVAEPSETPLKAVLFDSCQMIHIRKEICDQLPTENLVSFTIFNSTTDYYKPEALQNCKNLVKVTFIHNKLNTIQLDLFKFNEKLQQIDLSNNAINYVKADEFSRNSLLEVLDLSFNQLPYLSLDPVPESLKFVNLAWNKIFWVNAGIRERPSIKWGLSQNFISCELIKMLPPNATVRPIVRMKALEGVKPMIENFHECYNENPSKVSEKEDKKNLAALANVELKLDGVSTELISVKGDSDRTRIVMYVLVGLLLALSLVAPIALFVMLSRVQRLLRDSEGLEMEEDAQYEEVIEGNRKWKVLVKPSPAPRNL